MKASDLTRMMTLSITLAGILGASLALAENQQTAQMDTTPGPAYTTVDGQVTKIEGELYTVQSGYPDSLGGGLNQNEVRLYVGQETKKIKGEKKVGDKIRAEVTRGGFANSIQ